MPRHPIRRALGLLSGLLLIFFILVFVASLMSVGTSRRLGRFVIPGTVAVIPLEGEIVSSDDFVETLKAVGERTSIRSVVVRINSPGGAVAPSQEMYGAIASLREKKPVIASLGSVAASGGYYVASAADVIVASPGTLTGSLGVILQLANVSSLLDKVGVQATVVKAGEHKDMGSPFRSLTPEEQALLQTMVDEVHAQFIDAVAAGRIAATRAGIEGEPRIEHISPRRTPWWWRWLASDRVPIGPAAAGALGLLEEVFITGAAGETGGRPLWRLPIATQGLQW